MKTKVAITRCTSYKEEEVGAAVEKALDLLGGIERFVKPNEKVLIKPNLLSARKPEEAVNTHPELVRAVIRRLRPVTRNIKIGDSGAGFGDNMDDIHEASGMKKMAGEEGIPLVKFNNSERQGHYPVATEVLEADKVINLPKFKTHVLTLITAAVKNMYGIIPGISKARQHSLAPHVKDFAPVLLDVYSIKKPELTLVDAIVSMEGDGPGGGEPRKTDFIIASRDAVAIDIVLMNIIGREPLDLETNREAGKRGIGATSLDGIELLGENVEGLIMRDFKFPSTSISNRVPRSLAWLLKLVIRFKVEILARKCKRCKLCEKACPVSAITIAKEACSIDYAKCLLCLCCQEICPHGAVYLRKSFLAKRIWR